MKKDFLLTIGCCIGLSMSAQHEVLDIYRNDNYFHHFRVSDVSEMRHIKDANSDFSYLRFGTNRIPFTAIDSCVVRQTTIPDIYINLTDYPGITDLFKTSGFTKATIYKATMRLDGNGEADDIAEQEVEFRGRGNSTWKYKKTPYRFKMAKKASVCGLPKAKSFALIANYLDPTHIRNTIAFWVARELGLPFTNHSVHCNLYFNGHYKGLYMLTEKIGIGSGSVDIDEDKGMLFELDVYYDDDYKFRYPLAQNSDGLPVMVKDPDLEEIKPDATERETYWKEWQADFTEMADAIMNQKNIGDYIDLREAAKFILVNNLACNRELNHPKSVNLFKEGLGKDNKYRFGPVWDFDWSTGFMAAGPSMNSYNRVLITGGNATPGVPFMRSLVSNPEFMAVYKEVWQEFMTNIYPRWMAYIDSYAYGIEPSARRDGLLWPDGWAEQNKTYAQSSFDTQKHIGNLKTWLTNRVNWLNKHSHLGLY